MNEGEEAEGTQAREPRAEGTHLGPGAEPVALVGPDASRVIEPSEPGSSSALRGVEMVALVASLMSMHALAIDVMLPALPAMGTELGLEDPNLRQWVIIGFAVGMGLGQLFSGPLSDRFGRRPVLLGSLAAYGVLGAACTVAPGFEELVLFRVLQGVASSGARVVAVAVVRDTFAGAAMARIMSLVMMTFMAVPILAPSLGQLVLYLASWRMIFWFLVAFAAVVALWAGLRLPETLPSSRRRKIDPRSLADAYLAVVRDRISRGYIIAVGLVFGALMAFLGASEQLFSAYGKGQSFPLYFATIAGGMAGANLLSARLVQTHGPRRVAHTALLTFILVQVAYIGTLSAGGTAFGFLYAQLFVSFGCLSLIGANFNAIALEPMGHVAGTASAALGFASTTLAAFFGGLIGQRFDGTARPFAWGFLALGLGALGFVLHAERGRLGAALAADDPDPEAPEAVPRPAHAVRRGRSGAG